MTETVPTMMHVIVAAFAALIVIKLESFKTDEFSFSFQKNFDRLEDSKYALAPFKNNLSFTWQRRQRRTVSKDFFESLAIHDLINNTYNKAKKIECDAIKAKRFLETLVIIFFFVVIVGLLGSIIIFENSDWEFEPMLLNDNLLIIDLKVLLTIIGGSVLVFLLIFASYVFFRTKKFVAYCRDAEEDIRHTMEFIESSLRDGGFGLYRGVSF